MQAHIAMEVIRAHIHSEPHECCNYVGSHLYEQNMLLHFIIYRTAMRMHLHDEAYVLDNFCGRTWFTAQGVLYVNRQSFRQLSALRRALV